jgi:hypothetical protein
VIAEHTIARQESPDMQALVPLSAPDVEQHGCPEPPHAPHVPGTPMPLLRPPQPSPDMHEPLVPVPQHDWPMAPHTAH